MIGQDISSIYIADLVDAQDLSKQVLDLIEKGDDVNEYGISLEVLAQVLNYTMNGMVSECTNGM